MIQSATLHLTGSPADLLQQMIDTHHELTNLLLKAREIHHVRAIEEYQAAALYHLAKPYNRNGARVLEIGTAQGYSASILAQALPDAQIITLNPQHDEAERARKHLARFANVTVIEQKSWDYLKVDSEPFDLIFCDGDHKNIRLDLPWLSRIRTGGLFLFHDFSPNGSARACPPVYRALLDFKAKLGRDFDVLVVDDQGVGMAGLVKRGGDDFDDAERDLLAGVGYYSTASFPVIAGLYRLAQAYRDQPGAILDVGAQHGGAGTALALGASSGHTLWLWDNFTGVPQPSAEDGEKARDRWQSKQPGGWAKGDAATARECLKKFELKGAKIISGDFADTFANPAYKTGRIAILHIDATLYASTKAALERFYEDVVTGGLVIVSAYHHWQGVQQAVNEFITAQGVQPRTHSLEKTAWWIK